MGSEIEFINLANQAGIQFEPGRRRPWLTNKGHLAESFRRSACATATAAGSTAAYGSFSPTSPAPTRTSPTTAVHLPRIRRRQPRLPAIDR